MISPTKKVVSKVRKMFFVAFFFLKINQCWSFFKAWLQDESLYPELVNWFVQWAVSCRCNISSHRAFCPRLETSKTECLRHLNKQRTHQITKATTRKSMKNQLFTHLIQGLSRIKSHQNPDQKQGALWSSGWRPSQVSCHRDFSRQGLVAKTPATVGIYSFLWRKPKLIISLVNPLLECFGRTQPAIKDE